MKSCPECQRTFSDEISFCLEDGTPLGSSLDPEEATVIRSTSFVPQPASAVRKSSVPVLACSVIVLLVLIVAAVVAAWLIFWGTANITSNSNQSNKDQDAINQQKANLQDQQAELEKERQRLANERKTLEDQTKKSNKIASPPHDEPTTRINFHRGSVQETVSGSVYVGRSYLLRTSRGQYLSASVTSANDCVVFGNGATSAGYTTNAGDSSLTILNKCGNPVDFSLTVSIR